MTEERERIRQQLLAAPRVVAAIVAAVREQVPAYAVLDDGRLDEVRAIAAWAVDGCCISGSPTARSPPPISGGSAESRRRGPRTAARCLGPHPQSLRYRLRRIADLTHRDPRDPWQRLTLDIARTIGH